MSIMGIAPVVTIMSITGNVPAVTITGITNIVPAAMTTSIMTTTMAGSPLCGCFWAVAFSCWVY